MMHRSRGLVVAFLLLPWFLAHAGAADDAVLAAREAFRIGDRNALARQIVPTRGHELQSYVDYWSLQQRIDEADPSEIMQFLAEERDTVLADRLRADWLRQLGMRRLWDDFDREFPALVRSGLEIDCYVLQRKIARGETSAQDEARTLWRSDSNLPSSCNPLMESLLNNGRLTTNDIWDRIRALLEAKRQSAAKLATTWLPGEEQPDAKTIDAIAANPLRYLVRLRPNFASTRVGREMALYALQRLARKDPQVAASQWESLKGKFSPTERGYLYGQLAYRAAQDHLPQAVSWFEAAGDTQLNDEQYQWKVRAGLRAGDWRFVRQAIESMPPALGEKPDWIYWRARALQNLGKSDEAQRLFESIGGQPTFYGVLADEELGRPITLPPTAAKPTKAEIARAAATPAIQRALALLRLDLRIEAIREWNWALRGQDDRFLLAAAELAQRNGIFDRAINAADRTRSEHDYAVRYMAPFRETVEPMTRELGLDKAWVYGLMRQESRFVATARSSAGAQGLMQLMPATARWVARKIGLKDFHPSRISNADLNVELGASYLKIVLEDLDNQPVLASAAYNAGPGRAQRWRDGKPLEGAIYAETIPFRETRDYVKNVMSNAVFYSALLDGKPHSLKARLGVVSPAAIIADAEPASTEEASE